MHRDYSAIICDLMMPGLPGDMFYLAVERTKPHLCERFVFITGHPEDPKFSEFLRQHKVPALLKPFKSQELLDIIARIVGQSGHKG
jgi:DNA-binding NtrC family response regulator